MERSDDESARGEVVMGQGEIYRANYKLVVDIRWLIRRDMPSVLEIERTSFDFPWTEDDFLYWLRQRNCIGMVAEIEAETRAATKDENRVVGFMVYSLHRSALRILDLAVHSGFRRTGVGSQMVDKLVSKLSLQGRREIELEVRETNIGAQLFFREQGFRAVSVLRDHYDDTDEDAYLMKLSINEDGKVVYDKRHPRNRIKWLLGD